MKVVDAADLIKIDEEALNKHDATKTGVLGKLREPKGCRVQIGEDKVIQIDALPLYKKYIDIFSMDDVPEEERKTVARQVADKIIAILKQDKRLEGGGSRDSLVPRDCQLAERESHCAHRPADGGSIAPKKSSSNIFSRVAMFASGDKADIARLVSPVAE